MFKWTSETDHLEETQDQNQAADKGLLGMRHSSGSHTAAGLSQSGRLTLAHDGIGERYSTQKGRHYKVFSAMPMSLSRALHTVWIDEEPAKSASQA